MKRRSLAARVLLFASVWAVVALIAIAFVIGELYRVRTERAEIDLLRAQLNTVINAVTISPEGVLQGRPELGDLAFAQPGSGWTWRVEPIGNDVSGALISPSASSQALAVPPVAAIPFDERYQRFYAANDAFGNALTVAETEVTLDDKGRAARFRVTANRAAISSDIDAFTNRLWLALGLFGAGSLVINALAILWGLRPLDEARLALARVREGKAETIDGDFPREIAPLAAEVNKLIDVNRRVVERARMQVGNLAHSLKTPIAVLMNESRTMDPVHGSLVATQASAMQAQVQAYLDRARIAAQRGSVIARTEAAPVVNRMVRVMAKLNPALEFSLDIEPPDMMIAVETQDLEEALGNLLENAAKYARGEVELTLASAMLDNGKPGVAITVSDDGPGLDDAAMKEAVKRGKRLDETKPGTGLGLSIVTEIAREYGGKFELSRSVSGGLAANLVFPAPDGGE